MNIQLGTYFNLTHLTILNVNFQLYQLNNCNCLFNCLSDITKTFLLFQCKKGKLFLFIFLPNCLALDNTMHESLNHTKNNFYSFILYGLLRWR